MKHIRKILCCLLVGAMLFALAGCQQSETPAPTATPEVTAEPTEAPTAEPTEAPTAEPTEAPTAEPTEAPTAEPTEAPTAEPTEAPTAEPAALSVTDAATPDEATTGEAVIGGADGPTDIVVTDEATPDEATTGEAVIGGADGPTDIVVTDAATASEAVYDPQPDDIVGTAGDDVTLTYGEAVADVEGMKLYYASMMSQYYGQVIDTEEEDYQLFIAENVVTSMLQEKVYLAVFDDLGLSITPEREQEIRDQAAAEFDAMYEQYLQLYAEAMPTAPEEEVAAQVDLLFEQSGYDRELLQRSAVVSEKLAMLYEEVTGDVSATEEDVQAAYDAQIAQAKETYDADRDAFLNDYLNGVQTVYTPEGVRLVQHVLVMKPEDEASEATASEATASEATASEAAPLEGRAKIEAALAALEAGEAFEDVAAAYSEDPALGDPIADAGYPVFAGSQTYDQSFVDNAMALQAVGDTTGIIETTYGYHILRYAADLTPGEIGLDALRESLTATVNDQKKTDAYVAAEEQWLAERPIELTNVQLLVVPEVVEPAAVPEEIYATPAEAAALTDVPGGDALATLEAGAGLSVEGRVSVDGTLYAYVQAVGTDFAGYVEDALLAVTDRETALAADNAAAVTAAELDAADKLPIFTIVMNDGSVIYGELYPQTAPQTVGNFVSLANAGFYDGLRFHRVIDGFMIQGGDPNGDGTGGPGYAVTGEFTGNGVENAISHERGVLSMARAEGYDTAGSQFFICQADATYLDGQYAAFGRVLGGMEAVDAIAAVKTDAADAPKTEQVMKLVRVQTYGVAYDFDKIID